METTELLAKILANENLVVRKAKVNTAAFDLVKRELILPMWQDLDPIVETMLVEHETGHALFTPVKYKDEVAAKPYLRSILNVVEDVRIERLFKERYPGSRKDFAGAAKVLRENDFFELAGIDVNTLNLIDRINIYSKLGVLTGVTFTKEELPYVQRTSRTVTFPEVVQLANDIYAFMKETFEEQQEGEGGFKAMTVDDEGEGDGEGDEFDDEFDEGEDGDDGFDSPSSVSGKSYLKTKDDEFAEAIEDYLQSKTEQLLASKLKELAGVNEPPTYFEVDEEYDRIPVTPYKDVLKQIRASGREVTRDYYDRFKVTVNKQVGHLVQQFELKKAAEVYARRRITKTGYIDVNKVSQYKIKDDIFRRNIKVSEGQNHGIVMLLDWSRSMISHSTIHYSIEQVMQMVMFCRNTGIPYKVFAFRDPVRHGLTYNQIYKNHCGDFVDLLEFFSSDMTLAEHNEMMVHCAQRTVLSVFPLSYTPLAPAILAMRQIIPEFKAKFKVQKLNFITFTDGENTCQIINNYSGGAVYIRDKVTKKNYIVRRDRTDNIKTNEVNAMYRIIKDRFNCTVTTFFVTYSINTHNVKSSGAVNIDVNTYGKLAKDFKQNGFATITGYGRDCLYLINSSILKTNEFDVSSINSNMSSAAIARSIKGASKGSLKNKVLIEKIADTIC
jgi:hypothetical protein